MASATTTWDAATQLAIGQYMKTYLIAFPPPADALFAADIRDWSDRLLASGRQHLAELALTREHLSLVPTSADTLKAS